MGRRGLRLSPGAKGETKDTGLAPFPGSGAASGCRPCCLVHFPSQQPRPVMPAPRGAEAGRVLSRVGRCVGGLPRGEGSRGSLRIGLWLRAAGEACGGPFCLGSLLRVGAPQPASQGTFAVTPATCQASGRKPELKPRFSHSLPL